MKIIAIPGSLRGRSFNTALLRTAATLAPAGVEIDVTSLSGIPLYDADLEAGGGIPLEVAELKDRIAAADARMLSTPEYNASIPGVAKNAFDWLSRPAADIKRVFGGKPLALLGATPGGGGTISAQAAWLPVFRALGVALWAGPRMYVSGAAKLFDAEGNLVDEATRTRLSEFVAGFVAHVERHR